MKKEIVWVVLTAFGLGLIITYGVLTAKKALDEQKKISDSLNPQDQSPTQLSTTPPPTIPSLTLTLYQPEDEAVIKEKEVLFKGQTAPNAVITILTEKNEFILEADQEGNFQTKIGLVDGANEIIISAFDEKANEVSKTITLVSTDVEI